MQKQSLSATNEVLVVNIIETIQPEDLVSIANSNELVGNHATQIASADKSCSYKASKTGNVVKITSTCESNGDDAKKFSNAVVESFSEAIVSVYNNENLEVKTITHGESEEQITKLNRAFYICLPALAGLALSAFIAFIKLDYATSKKRK